jgi:hypothetical protein
MILAAESSERFERMRFELLARGLRIALGGKSLPSVASSVVLCAEAATVEFADARPLTVSGCEPGLNILSDDLGRRD